MSTLYFSAAAFILVMIALGLLRVLRGPGTADRLMAAQLIGSGGVAVLLLLSAAAGLPAIADVALMLAVLAVFASVAFVNWGAGRDA
ncbi:monovalent cation/H+ antiporter complex subunit F [Aestuariivirga sp.]|uniref:monovalent cation/H+ antiporter complex subunit F n=1 Tax=Aestuariivirga sp. TaxID=2650926 RepID=UPI00391CBCBE